MIGNDTLGADCRSIDDGIAFRIDTVEAVIHARDSHPVRCRDTTRQGAAAPEGFPRLCVALDADILGRVAKVSASLLATSPTFHEES